MNYYWDNLEGLPGIKSPRPQKGSGSTMGGWYASIGHYKNEELDGLSITRFCEAVRAEGVDINPGCNMALHLHPLLNTLDVYNDGRPTVIANSEKDIRGFGGPLPVSKGIQSKVFRVPWFKKYNEKVIKEYADAVKKVVENYRELVKDDPGDPENMGSWNLSFR